MKFLSGVYYLFPIPFLNLTIAKLCYWLYLNAIEKSQKQEAKNLVRKRYVVSKNQI